MNTHMRAPSPRLSNKALAALTEALESEFTSGDWSKLGVALGLPQLHSPELRLQKSLRFGDEDYATCVAEFVQHMHEEDAAELHDLGRRPKLEKWLLANAPAAAVEFGLGQAQVAAPAPPPSASQAVELALRDAERLLTANGATSCVDRMHTALHGYLREEAAKASLSAADDASLPALFKALRNGHPRFKAAGPHGDAVSKVLMSLASCVDTLNTLRNNATPAHPNEDLLDEAEAMLAVNAVRSIFNYLRAKL